MKKAVCIVVALVLCLGTVGFGIYYISPTAFLKGIASEDVGCIAIFNGSTGARFTVTNQAEIQTIVTNLQSITAKRCGLSVNEDGFSYQLTFMNGQGKTVDTVTVNSPNAIRRDPFFYEITDGEVCYSFLQSLEILYANSGDSGLHSGVLENGGRWFEGTVLSVNGTSMQVSPCADTWEHQSSGKEGITVTLRLTDGSVAPAPQKGDTVKITYNGMIAESYPPQILHVYHITVLK